MRIQLTGNTPERNRAFYWLMRNGTTFSNEMDIFHISESLFEKLEEQNFKYKVIAT